MLQRVTPSGPNILAALFVAYAASGATIMAVLVPPFCNVDEAAHFERADQVSRGVMVPSRPGGRVDLGIADVAGRFDAVRGHADVKISRAMLKAAGETRWSRSGEAGFPNTAVYPPIGYLPAAAAILAGKHFGWPVTATLHAARLANATVCIAACAAAITVAGDVAPLLFTVLCLPMSLALFAAVSQDGVLIAAAAWAATLASRAGTGRTVFPIAACLCVMALGRPPYLAMAGVLLSLDVPVRRRLAGLAAVIGIVLAWVVCCAGPIEAAVTRPPGVDPTRQLAWLARHGAMLYQVPIVVMAHQWTDGLPYARQFVGVLGTLDVALPGSYIAAAWGVIALALVLARPVTMRTRGWRVVLAALLVSCAGVFAVQYLTWTEIGSHLVEGIQGRYFLPLALLVPLALPQHQAWGRRMRLAWVPITVFPALSLAVAAHALMQRYYG